MAHQQAAEELVAPPRVDVTSSYPNTPLSTNRPEQRSRQCCPVVSGKLLFTTTSTPCFPSAGGVQQSYLLRAPCSAGTFQLQEASAPLPLLSPPDGYDRSSAAQRPPCISATHLFDQRLRSAIEGQRCHSFVAVLLDATCLAFQAVSRQTLEQHVRKRKFKRCCEAFLRRLRVSVGSIAAPAFPSHAVWPALVVAASLCTLKEQRVVLLSGHGESTPGSSYMSSGTTHDSSISLPYFGAGPYSAQAQYAPSGAVSNVPCARAAGFSAPASARSTFAGGTLPDDNALAVADFSFSVAADRSTEGNPPHLRHYVLPSSARTDETACSQQLASNAAQKQHTFCVQHICVCGDEDGVSGVALQFALPTQQGKEEVGEDVITLDGVASAIDEVADSGGGKGGNKAAGFAERMNGTRGEGGAQPREASVAAQEADLATGRHGGERQRASSASRVTERFPAHSAPACGSVTVESLTSLAAPVNAEAGAAREAAVPADALAAATAELRIVEKEHEFARGKDDRERGISTEDERSGAAAAAAPVVAALTCHQMKGVVGAADFYCGELEEDLHCIAENMLQLHRLSQVEAVRHALETDQKNDTCTPGEERHVDSRATKDSGDSGANRRHSGTAYSDAGERNCSSGKDGSLQREVSGTERPQGVDTSRTIEDRESSSVEDRTGTVTASPSPLQRQQLTFMSALQELRLPRDKGFTAAEVLGLSPSLDTATTTAESASESGDQLQDAVARSDTLAAVSEETTAAGAITTAKQREAGEPPDSEAGDRQQRSPRGARGANSDDARGGLASAADGICTAAATAVETEGDVRHTGRYRKGSTRQKRRIVSLADVLDLSVLERGRQSVVATTRWQRKALTVGQLRKCKEAVVRRRVAEAMGAIVDVAGVAARERQVRRQSSESSVILLEPSEGSIDESAQTGETVEHDMSPSKRNAGTRRDAEDASPAAGKSSHDEDLFANVREVELLYKVVGEEVLQLLRLVQLCENCSFEYLRQDMQGSDLSDGECNRSGERV